MSWSASSRRPPPTEPGAAFCIFSWPKRNRSASRCDRCVTWHALPVRIATWNLEQAQPSSAAGQLQTEVMTEVAADIWIVTEAPAQFPLTGFATADSAPMLTARPAAFTIIAAPELTQLPVPELPTGTAALIENRDGKWLVVGVCMPWRAGSPTLPPQAAPGASTGPAQWHHVLSALDAAINRLRTVAPDAELLLGGDFNQTFASHVVGSHRGRAALKQMVITQGLTSYTARSLSATSGCLAIDHLFGPPTRTTARCWMPPAPAGRAMTCSDHAGYVIDLAAAPPACA